MTWIITESTMMDHGIPLDRVLQTVKIPTIPTLYLRVSKAAQNPSSSIPEVAGIIEEDPAIAAQILRIVNSAAFGLESPVASLALACAALGMRFIRNIVLQVSLMKNYQYLQTNGFDVEKVWKHSVLTATICRNLAKKKRSYIELNQDEAYTCGLLHDIGDIVLMDNFPRYVIEIRDMVAANQFSKTDAELKKFGYTHAEVGAAVAQKWKFPDIIVQAIRWHHRVPAKVAHESSCLLVATAHNLVKSLEVGQVLETDAEAAQQLIEKLGLRHEDFLQEFQQALALNLSPS